MNQSNPANNPMWGEIGNALKPLLRIAQGDVGLFLIKKGEAVAALVVGDMHTVEQKDIAEALNVFRQRIGELAEYAESGQFDLENGDQCFVRDTNTGEYKGYPNSPLNEDN